MGTPEKRRININMIYNAIARLDKEKGEETDKEKLISLFSVQYGIARRTCIEYIDGLKTVGKIYEKNGMLGIEPNNKDDYFGDIFNFKKDGESET